MTAIFTMLSFAAAALLYAAASGLFFVDVARQRGPSPRPLMPAAHAKIAAEHATAPAQKRSAAPAFLGGAALLHTAYIGIASFVAHVCPVHSVHFLLSVASLLAVAVFFIARLRFRIDALGLIVAPLGLAFLLGTYFLGSPHPSLNLGSFFIATHVLANLLGIALFLLAFGSAALYLVQEKRLKKKRPLFSAGSLPPLDLLDRAEHRFLIAGFPLLTLGIITGTYWAQKLESGTTDEVMRIVLGYATWLLFAIVLLLRAAVGFRGRRAAYGTIAGFACAAAVIVIYLVRPDVAARLGG